MTKMKLAILGSGPAGYTAAIYAARAGWKPLVFAGPEPGGQLINTTDVGNFPGFPEDILGPELMERMQKQAERFGATVVPTSITKVDFRQQPFWLWAEKDAYQAEAVIIATGAATRWLGLPSEQRLRGKGVSSCATCDGFFFKGKDVAVVGGGDAAMEEALYLTKFASSITILVRGDALRASNIMVARAKANTKISFRLQTEVADVQGETKVTGLRLKNTVTNSTEDLKVQGMFVAIGHVPNTALFQEYLQVNKRGYLAVTDQVMTSIPGIFVAGDVQDYRYRQAISAAGWGCMAALEAEKYLEMLHHQKHGRL
ncbi:MAG: thioredoxin-disulfide reductase [Candidatus Kerfeldbacteria bacterium]|nr:thioredoxin-disulfide reductase [Candidatus Kerfeldbacteria bacterium]